MDTLNNYGAILAILTLVLGAGIYLYGTAKRGRADIIRQDNADLRASNQELRQEKAGLLATTTQQADTIKNLREVATQTPAVTQLLEMTNRQQQITNKQHSDVIKEISNLAKRMAEMTTEFSKVAQAMAVNTKSQNSNMASRNKE